MHEQKKSKLHFNQELTQNLFFASSSLWLSALATAIHRKSQIFAWTSRYQKVSLLNVLNDGDDQRLMVFWRWHTNPPFISIKMLMLINREWIGVWCRPVCKSSQWLWYYPYDFRSWHISAGHIAGSVCICISSLSEIISAGEVRNVCVSEWNRSNSKS